MKRFYALTLSALIALNAALPVLADEAPVTAEVSEEISAEAEISGDDFLTFDEETKPAEETAAEEEEEEADEDVEEAAEEETAVDAYATNEADFKFDPKSGTITGYLGAGGDVVIPSSIAGIIHGNSLLCSDKHKTIAKFQKKILYPAYQSLFQVTLQYRLIFGYTEKLIM